MSATAKRPTATVLSAAYVTFLRGYEPPALFALREAANPYRRAHLRSAWEAGWHAWRVRVPLGAGFTSPLLSKPARAAWVKGHQAREAIEALSPMGDTQ